VQLPLKTFTLPPATHTNAYFVGRDELVLVDPGSADPAEVARLEQAVAALAREGRRVSAIWLTHHHPDHIGGVPLLVERLGLPVAAHAETAARLGRQGIAVTRLLEDGQVVELAGDPPYRLRVLHTPGHARGHLCFLAEETGSLLTGDMISTVSTIVVDPPEGDMDDYLASLSKLLEVGAQTAFPSHGPPAARARQKLQEFIDHRLWREEKLLEAWATGARSHAELRAAAYEDTPPIAYPLAERQIEAHLQRLRRAGRIS
nr:MBL fold metallo-hydrolase [Thermoanaerobaculia bacterium]